MEDYDPESLSKADAFDAANSKYRQVIIDLLLDAEVGDRFDLDTFAQDVATEIDPKPTASTETDHTAKVEIALLHHHLPRLAREDVVWFDEETHRVGPGANIDDLEPLI